MVIVGCSTNESQPNTPKENETAEKSEDKDETKKEEEIKESDDVDNEIKSKVLRDILNAETYTMKLRQIIKRDDFETTSLVTNVVSDEKTYTHSDIEGNILESVDIGDKSYLILSESKKIIVSNRYEEEDLEDIDNIVVYDDLKYLGSGKEEFLDNNYNYEEYEVEVGRVKYYINKDELVGMEMLFDMNKILDEEDIEDEDFEMGDAVMLVEVLSYEKTADMSVFELPEDYEMVGN